MNAASSPNLFLRAGRMLAAAALFLGLSLGVYAAPNWGQKSPPNDPPPSSSSAMAFDAVRGQAVLFRAGETWVWDGSTWTNKSPATSPSNRSRHAMAYDSVRHQVVLFGGLESGSPNWLLDTWVWDGVNWTQKFPVTNPTSTGYRFGNPLAFDAAHGEAVLVNDSGTWVWDGTNWTQVVDAFNSPDPSNAAMAFDKANGQVVAFSRGLTWIWNGAQWSRRFQVSGPPALIDPALAFDEQRQRVVMFGGWINTGFAVDSNATWVWDGASWSKSAPQTSPAARHRHAMAYDPIRAQLVLFGGRTLNGSTIFADTWVYPSNSIVATNGTPQSAAPMSLFGAPLEVTVTDILGSPVDGDVVSFMADPSLVSLSSLTAITGPDGKAQVSATATAVAAGYVVAATIADGGRATFNLTNAPSAAGSMTPLADTSPQSMSVQQPFVTALSLLVKDAFGNPAPGVVVTFAAPAAGASGLFANSSSVAQVTSDANGVATAPVFVANAVAGTYGVTASAAGWTGVAFALTNQRGPATVMTATADSTPQSAAIGQAFAVPLAVAVADINNNTAAGITVTFTAPVAGATGTFANGTTTTTAVTAANGIATATLFTAKTSPGSQFNVVASSIGLADVGFSLTNTGAAASAVSWGNRTATSAAGLFKIGLAPDASGKVVLADGGGALGGGAAEGRTWLWNGSVWTVATAAPNPARFGYAVAYDAARRKVVLFGGQNLMPGGQSATPPFGDTWEWDGASWTKRAPAQSPPAQVGHAMAYDAARQHAVLFGGGQTWTWDGTNWTQKSPALNPPALYEPRMAYDAARAQVVLVGASQLFGSLQTWVWNGTAWTKKTPAQNPSNLFSYAIAYDAPRQQVVMFGQDETWVWNGTNWAKKTPATSPPYRSYHALTYDPAHGVVVLYGGAVGNTVLSDTWTWDGTTWTGKGGSSISPPAGRYAAMAPEPTPGQLVLFSGNDKKDTWVWDGSKWAKKAPATSPLARRNHAMAFDAARNQTVMFGGYGGVGNDECFSTCNDGTWVWNGTTWTQKTPAFSPPPQDVHAMAYDAARQQIVLYGLRPTDTIGNTFTWDGVNWTQRASATFPPFRNNPALAFDAARQLVILFGGELNGMLFNDTWAWDGTTWTQKSPTTSPPAQSGQQMAYDASRQRVVMFGQFGAGTWTWDGANWTQQLPLVGPSARFGHAVAYDSVRAQTVLFGGSLNYSESFDDTWVYPASVVTANAGTPQSTPPGQPFGTALSVLVNDGSNNPLPGAVVTFAAPPFGAGGTFANGSIVAQATSDANGIATAPSFTANATAGGYDVTASASGIDVKFTLSNGAVVPSPNFALAVSRTGAGLGKVAGSGINCGVDCTENYPSGTSVAITASPDPNAPGGSYYFAGWGGDCSGFGSLPTCTLGMTSAKNAIATFGYIGVGSAYSRNYVQKAYVAYYGRPADPGGQGYWAGRLDAAGGSLDAIIGEFGSSNEFNQRYGGLNYSALVTKIYQQTLGRDPDQGGLDYYVGELQAGRRTLQSITLDVLNGAVTPPDATVVANRLDVAAHYTAKVAAGCAYGTEQDGVSSLSGVMASAATVTTAKAAIDSRCGP